MSLRVSERYLWALSVIHIIISLASKVNSGNEIELGMKIPTIESQASNIPMTKGITYVDIAVRPIKIFIEYVGTNMSV